MEYDDEMDTAEASTSRDDQSALDKDNECTRSKEEDEQDEDAGDCLLCDQPMTLSKSTIVKQRRIENLVQASKRRRDNKHLELEQLLEIRLHKTCQTIYTRESNIKIAIKALQQANQQNRERRRAGRDFNFSLNCFFCSNVLFNAQNCKRVSKQITIDNIVSQLKVYDKNEMNKILSARLCQLQDKNDAYYIDNNVSYHAKCLSKFYQYCPNNVRGKPISENMSDVLVYIINYLLENSEECQFSLKEILEKYTEEKGEADIPRLDKIENHLKQHFDDEIVVYSTRNDRFICFKRMLGNCLENSWYSDRKSNEQEERQRIVEMAAHIILQDIRAMKFDTSTYNSPSDFLNDVTKDVPSTLQTFLDILMKTHKRTPKHGSWKKWENKISTAAHILMTSVRPRSFCSPILLGLSCMMHAKFSARGLIDCLYNVGLCASYPETVRFESSIVNDPEKFNIVSDTYLQFVYDNADHNTATIDGKNTFHCMGGIMCVTPSSSVTCNSTIPRLKGVLPKASESTSGFLPLTDFINKKPFKLDTVIVQDWKGVNFTDFTIKVDPIDVLYFYGKHSEPGKTANWHGFMNKCHEFNADFNTTKVIALPFIKAPPSDHTTILTALIDARQRANQNKQKHCFVTFDLPLFVKACEIIASIDPANDPHNLRSVILRLGGFHLLMSFLGAIGNIMTGSGLKEAFYIFYAELSADKALAGHAFSRSIRGHFIIHAALAIIIFAKIELDENEKKFLSEGLKKVGKENIEEFLADPIMKTIEEKFTAAIDKLEKNGPTSQLWVQYFKLICLVLRYIDAERSGNFDLHLEIVLLMIPIFFASGHHLYAKACLLYVQQMLKLKECMDIIEYDKFCKQGFFTIRRSNRFWCGVWSDMTIEQVLMRAMKCCGGLTHGRGLTDNVIAKWILSRVAVLEVSNVMELFCNMTFSSSEQHVDNRVARISRDASDLEKVRKFFATYDPFPETDQIMGIYSGVIGDLSTVNCYNAYEIGKALMDATSNKKFTDVKYKRSSKVVHLAAANSTMKNAANEEVYISPLLIFQKICLNIESKEDMKEYASSYELSPIPLSLFDEYGMRKTAKYAFFSNFNFSYEINSATNVTHVVDGGFFLHKVVWQSNLKVSDIVSRYVSYAKKHYTPNSCIVFDGYPEDDTLSTKSIERSRRQLKNIGREIAFDENTTIAVNQTQFLNNERNKSRLIDMICTSLNKAGYRTKIAPEDADRLIIVTAIENARSDSEATIYIIGEDTDLLVIFSQLADNMNNIYFCRQCKGSKPVEYYNSSSFKYPNLKKIVAFLHAFCGCDTTSCFYKLGKNKLIESIAHEKLLELAVVFNDENASHDQIAKSAFELIRGMYSNKAEKKLIEKARSFSLNDLRYLHFNKAKIKTTFALQTLPPTEGAAKQHAFRVYYQVQLWLGNTNLIPTDWGWQIKNNHLIPIGSTDPPIPQKLLDQISCSCSKKGCIDGSCGCKKHGLKCSHLCANCSEDTCFNFETNDQPAESEDESTLDDDLIEENNDFIAPENIDENIEEIECLEPARKKRRIL